MREEVYLALYKHLSLIHPPKASTTLSFLSSRKPENIKLESLRMTVSSSIMVSSFTQSSIDWENQWAILKTVVPFHSWLQTTQIYPQILSSGSHKYVIVSLSPLLLLSYVHLSCSTACYLYDYVLTLSQEIKCVWRRRFSVASLLFVVIRYAALCYNALTMAHLILWTPDQVSIAEIVRVINVQDSLRLIQVYRRWVSLLIQPWSLTKGPIPQSCRITFILEDVCTVLIYSVVASERIYVSFLFRSVSSSCSALSSLFSLKNVCNMEQ